MNLPNEGETDSGLAGQKVAADGGVTRTSIRVPLPEEILQLLRERATSREVSVLNYAAYVLTKAVMEG